MKNKLILSSIGLSLIILTGCSVLNSTKSKSGKNDIYKVEKSLPPFKQTNVEHVDYAFEYQNTFLIANSECAKYEPGSLENKTNRLLRSFDEEKVRSTTKIKIRNNFSVQKIHAEVLKDNESFMIDLITFDRSNCLIDIYYLAPKEKYQTQTFDEFIKNVVVY